MRLFSTSQVYPDDFSTVALAYILRYPNPFARHIISVDVLSRTLTEEGTLKTTRLILKSGKIPMWAMALVGGKGVGAWVLEESECNPYPPYKYLKATTRNINHGHLLSVHETTLLHPTPIPLTSITPAPPSTTHETTGIITTQLNVGQVLREKVEGFGEGRFVRGIEKSKLGLLDVITKLKERRLKLRESAGRSVGLVGLG